MKLPYSLHTSLWPALTVLFLCRKNTDLICQTKIRFHTELCAHCSLLYCIAEVIQLGWSWFEELNLKSSFTIHWPWTTSLGTVFELSTLDWKSLNHKQLFCKNELQLVQSCRICRGSPGAWFVAEASYRTGVHSESLTCQNSKQNKWWQRVSHGIKSTDLCIPWVMKYLLIFHPVMSWGLC